MTPRYTAAMVLVASIGACVTVSPYDNFKESERLMVGTSIDAPRTNIRPELLLSKRSLASGLIEYRYRSMGDCVRIFEVEPKSGSIMSANHTGSEQSCAIPP
jgi:hypothetical protein